MSDSIEKPIICIICRNNEKTIINTLNSIGDAEKKIYLYNNKFSNFSNKIQNIFSFQNFKQIINRENIKSGLIIIRSGVILPEYWKEIIFSIMKIEYKFGTLSLQCNSNPFSPPPYFSNKRNINLTDSLYFIFSKKILFEIPCPATDFFWINPLAISLFFNNDDDPFLNVKSFWNISQKVRNMGFPHLMTDASYVHQSFSDDFESEIIKIPLVQKVNQSLSDVLQPFHNEIAQRANKKIPDDLRPALHEKPVQLHIMHGWGGGLQTWVHEFCQNDDKRINLILSPVGTWNEFGQRLELKFSNNSSPLRSWNLELPIRSTSIRHIQYLKIIEEIIQKFGIDCILVSSLIGHSLDILDTDLPTIIVAHDHYPFCPSLYAFYNTQCRECSFEKLRECIQNNQHKFFLDISAEEWKKLRKSYIDRIQNRNISIVTPSHFLKDSLIRLEPRFTNIDFHIIPHGLKILKSWEKFIIQKKSKNAKFRLLVLGNLSPWKGLNLLEKIIQRSPEKIEFHLIGCSEYGRLLTVFPQVHVIPSYSRENLGQIIQSISPDMGLLLSICPETFSYTLSELFFFNIPVLATNLGSFAERIQDGENGFLSEPDSDDILEKITTLYNNEILLDRVRKNLVAHHLVGIKEMIEAYHALLRPIPGKVWPRWSFGGQSSYRETYAHIHPETPLAEFFSLSQEYLQSKVDETPALSKQIYQRAGKLTIRYFFGFLRRCLFIKDHLVFQNIRKNK